MRKELTKMDVIQHEFLIMPQKNLPIRIIKRHYNKSNLGCEFHWHEQLEFYFIVSGGVHLLCNGEKTWVKSQEIAFVNWCQPHKSLEFIDNTHFYVIQIDLSYFTVENDVLNKYYNLLKNNSHKTPLKTSANGEILKCITNLINEFNLQKHGFELIIISEIIKLLATIIRFYVDKNAENINDSIKLINKILLYISKNYTNEIKLQDIADNLGISVQYACKIFKANTGTTIIKYINQLRCSRANSLISKGCTVTEAALSVGFNDLNYFSRVYKTIYGTSPSKLIGDNKQI